MNSFSALHPKSDHLRDGVRSHVNYHLKATVMSVATNTEPWKPAHLPVAGSSEAGHRAAQLSYVLCRLSTREHKPSLNCLVLPPSPWDKVLLLSPVETSKGGSRGGCCSGGISSISITSGETLDCFKKGKHTVKFMFWKQHSRI